VSQEAKERLVEEALQRDCRRIAELDGTLRRHLQEIAELKLARKLFRRKVLEAGLIAESEWKTLQEVSRQAHELPGEQSRAFKEAMSAFQRSDKLREALEACSERLQQEEHNAREDLELLEAKRAWLEKTRARVDEIEQKRISLTLQRDKLLEEKRAIEAAAQHNAQKLKQQNVDSPERQKQLAELQREKTAAQKEVAALESEFVRIREECARERDALPNSKMNISQQRQTLEALAPKVSAAMSRIPADLQRKLGMPLSSASVREAVPERLQRLCEEKLTLLEVYLRRKEEEAELAVAKSFLVHLGRKQN